MKEYITDLVKQEVIALGETKKKDSRGTVRDYKKEYAKYGSSKKAKKYRAELNKYNRKKGTYGNGDGKDASHKGGKIVGFESQSKNRGRAEKSRLKKESMIVENPIVAATVMHMTKMHMTNPNTGRKIKASTPLRNPEHPLHNKSKSIFQKIKDKLKKKEEPQSKADQYKALMQKTKDDAHYAKQYTGESVNEAYKKIGKKVIKYKDKTGSWNWDIESGIDTDVLDGKTPKIMINYQHKDEKGFPKSGGNFFWLKEKDGTPYTPQKAKAFLNKIAKKNTIEKFLDSIKPSGTGNLVVYKGGKFVRESVNEAKKLYVVRGMEEFTGKEQEISTPLEKSKANALVKTILKQQKQSGMDIYTKMKLVPVNESINDRMKDVMQRLSKSLRLKSVVSMHTGTGSFSYFIDDEREAKKLAQLLKKHLKRVRIINLDKSKGDTANFVVAADLLGLESVNERKNPKREKIKKEFLQSIKSMEMNIRRIKRFVKANHWGPVSQFVEDGLVYDVRDLEREIDQIISMPVDESLNEAGLEMKKLKDAIKMFQKKIKKQGRVTNARDEEHLKNLIKVYKQMGGKGIKESIIKENLMSFYKYMGDFYGKKGIYPDKKGRDLKVGDINKALSVYLKKYAKDTFTGDSLDRERVRDILIKMRKLDPDYSKKESVNEKKGVPGSVFTIDTAKETSELMTKALKKVAPDIRRGQIYYSDLGGADRVSIVGKFSLDPKKTWANNILENSRFITFHLDNDGTLEVNVNGYPFAMRRKVQMRKSRNNDIKQVLKRMITHFSMLNKKYPEGM